MRSTFHAPITNMRGKKSHRCCSAFNLKEAYLDKLELKEMNEAVIIGWGNHLEYDTEGEVISQKN